MPRQLTIDDFEENELQDVYPSGGKQLSLDDFGEGELVDAKSYAQGREPEERSFMSPAVDYGKGFVSGIKHRLPEMVGQAGQFLGIESGKKLADWGREGEERKERGAFYQAGEMTTVSAAIPMALNALGTGIMFLPVPGARPVGGALKIASYVLTPAMFGLSQAQQTKETAEQQGIDPGAAPYITGGIETTGETIGNMALLRLLGPLAPTIPLAKAGAKQLLKSTIGRFGKQLLLKTLPTEVLTEIGQQYGEATVEKAYNIRPDAQPIKEAMSVIAPTAIMTIVSGTAGGTYQNVQANRLLKGLTDPSVEESKRRDAVNAVAGVISAQEDNKDKPIANLWLHYAHGQIDNSLPIDISEPVDGLSPKKSAARDTLLSEDEQDVTAKELLTGEKEEPAAADTFAGAESSLDAEEAAAAYEDEMLEKEAAPAPKWLNDLTDNDISKRINNLESTQAARGLSAKQTQNLGMLQQELENRGLPAQEAKEIKKPVTETTKPKHKSKKGWDITPADENEMWGQMMNHVEAVKAENTGAIDDLNNELKALKSSRKKEDVARKKEIKKEIVALKAQHEDLQTRYENDMVEASMAFVDEARDKAKKAGVPEDALDDFTEDFSMQISQERPYIENNYNRTFKQIFDETIADYLPEGAKEKAVKPAPTEPKTDVALEPVGVEKKSVEFIDMQERPNKTPIPLVNELDTKSTVVYDPAKHEMTNLAEYEKAVAGEKVEIPTKAEIESEQPGKDRSPKINSIRIAKTKDTKSYADIKNMEADKTITVYRAIPAGTKGKIEPGDFVAADREVANFYANDLIKRGITNETIMLSKEVPASEIRLHPDHQAQGVENEFIYNPEAVKATTPKPPEAKPSEDTGKEVDEIGLNTNGDKIYEDENGRYLMSADGKFKSHAPRPIGPQGEKFKPDTPRELYNRGRVDYLTTQEKAEFDALLEKKLAPEKATADKLASEMTADELLAELDRQVEEIEESNQGPTAKQKARETADHLNNALGAFKDINKILGERGSFSTKEIDKSLYKEIEPLLKYAWDEVVASGKSGKEFIQIALSNLSPKGKPYIERFVKEEIGKEGKDVTNNTGREKPQETAKADDTGRIAGESAKDVSGVEKESRSAEVPERDRGTDDGGVQGRVGKSGDKTQRGRDRQKRPDSAGARNGDVAKENLGRDTGNISGLQRSDYTIKPGSLKREGSWKDAANNNLDAIELLKKINNEKRPATPKEQAILAKYVGWGASELANKMFPGYTQFGEVKTGWSESGWEAPVKRLIKLLTPEEIKPAAKSTQYAHYTNEPIIKSIYNALGRMGFKGGKILEPGMGIGNFIGLLPAKMRKTSNYTGIEMDPISANIAKLLYPTQNILQADFVNQAFPKNFFDAAIGNPPFGSTKILGDPEYRKHRFSLHNFFFAKTIDRVKPGGLLVFVTSRYTMDSKADKARQYMAGRADLLGAIRLPQTAFLESAGTEVVTDVLFLQKREEGAKQKGEAWAGQDEIAIGDNTSLINEYFVNHPGMVLGEHSLEGSMYGAKQYTVKPIEGKIEDLFAQAVKKLPANVYQKVSTKIKEKYNEKAVIERDFDPKNKKEGGIYLSDKGVVMKVDFGSGVPVGSIHKNITTKTTGFLKSYIKLRDALKLSHKSQLENGDWEKTLKVLNREYNKFVKKHGHILAFTSTMRTKHNEDGTTEKVEYRKYKNEAILRIDCESSLVMALEKITQDGEVIKSRVLQDRTINKPTVPKIKSIPDALAVSLDAIGKLDINHVAKTVNKSSEEVIAALGDLIYDTPDGSGYLMADEYLSGNVVKKLEEARIAAKTDPAFKRNVLALEKAQPEPLEPKQITITPGATWIPLDYYSQFATDVLELPNTEVTYQPIDNSWRVLPRADTRPSWQRYGNKQGYSPQELRGATSEWGTKERGANEILDSVLNNRTIRITYTIEEGGSRKTIFDAEATAAANEVAKKIRQRFNSWAWEDADRAGILLNIYNTKINTIKGREFDGSHLTLPGMSQYFTPYDHQKRVIWRILQTGNTYMAHAVGAGKTFIMISAGMEMRRLGMINKPLYVVPKHMLGQFAQEFQELYPMANILVADEKNFYTENRKRFVAQATLNDPDAVILTHPSFGMLGVKEETLAPVRDEFLEQMRFSLSEMKDEGEPKMKIKRMEKRIEQAEQRFNSLRSDGDNVVSFEELGTDFMFVDEAHEFRKLDFSTNRQMKGIDPQGSRRAIDLYIKTLWMEKQHRGRSHAFASGTPIVNTLGELYSLQRFFDQGAMEEDGINHFDAWANMFGEPATSYEMTASGSYEPVERFSRFVNIPELMSRIRMFMDVLTDSQLGTRVERPKIKDGAAEIVLAPKNEALKKYQDEVLQPRIETSRAWKPSLGQPGNPDPIINIITDGKLASIDMRFVDRKAINDPESKLNKWIDGIIETYKATKDLTYSTEYGLTKKSPIKGGVQICFYNNGFGSGVIERRGFDSKAFLMKRLKTANIPTKHIGWIDDYKTAPQKQTLFKLVRDGKKRILLGSAKKMGTGVNVQNRLTHLHYLDAPWYPADVEQPDGRIVRQGNQNTEVVLKRYATKGSYDATLWQMVARKSKFIDQAFVGDKNVRSIEDVSESSQYEMAAALASGDERIIQLVGLRSDIERLHLLEGAHRTNQATLSSDKRKLERDISENQGEIEDFESIEESLPEYIGPKIDAKSGKKTFTERKEFGAVLIKQIRKIFAGKKNDQVKLGSISGIDINTDTILVSELSHKLDIEISKGAFRRVIDNTYMSIDQWNEIDAVGLTKKITNAINGLP